MNVTIMLEIRKSLRLLTDDQQRMQFLHNIGQWVNHEITKLNEKVTTIFLEKVEPDEVQEIENSTIWNTENEILDSIENTSSVQEDGQCERTIDNESGTEIIPEVASLETGFVETVEKDVDTTETPCNNEHT